MKYRCVDPVTLDKSKLTKGAIYDCTEVKLDDIVLMLRFVDDDWNEVTLSARRFERVDDEPVS